MTDKPEWRCGCPGYCEGPPGEKTSWIGWLLLVATAVLAVLMLCCSCALLREPVTVSSPVEVGYQSYAIDDTNDPRLADAAADARAMWAHAGVVVTPYVPIVIGVPPDGAAGTCFHGDLPYVLVRDYRVDVIAHELGHCALGLRHVETYGELMAPEIANGATIGPETLAEARRAGVLP